ncbi:MAG: rhodanese-like domain-containing protein [Alphaproteobacteria bacterium]
MGATPTTGGGAERSRSYAGDLSPREAWDILAHEPRAVLVDVRTQPEWTFVGVPDLSGLGREAELVSWQDYPTMAHNPRFSDELAHLAKDAPILFLCRSGARSRAAAIALSELGFARCYNIAGGFEGNLDADGHRGVGGWKAAGLPWRQN